MTPKLSNNSSATTGSLFVVSGPSGVGKGTLVAEAMKALPDLAFSISATTRAPRRGDIDGGTYHFLTNQEFDELIANGGMLEWAEVHGHRYGTLTAEVQRALAAGEDIILEIDVQGNKQVKEQIPETFSIFIAPPSLAILRDRLETRATEDASTIERRLGMAEVELEEKDSYNAVIVNDDLERAAQELIDTIKKHRIERSPA